MLLRSVRDCARIASPASSSAACGSGALASLAMVGSHGVLLRILSLALITRALLMPR